MDVLDQLYARLQKALASRSSGLLAPFTVAQLYQQLIPYRAVRAELGLLELAPYEHALLRLLAGERGYLAIPRSGVVEELRRELREPNPILGVYRDYAEVEVFLSGDDTLDDPGRDGVEFVAPPLALPPHPQPSTPPPPPARLAAEPRSIDAHVSAPPDRVNAPTPPSVPRPGTTVGGAAECIRCQQELPEVEGLRFCPACGTDQREADCDDCGAPVRSDWAYCVRCGNRRRPTSG